MGVDTQFMWGEGLMISPVVAQVKVLVSFYTLKFFCGKKKPFMKILVPLYKLLVDLNY